MAELQTNFNVAPYFDDYNANNQYYRILFRPSVAVQARELTQLQTILQQQVSRFGSSIYKDGSIIDGCHFKTYTNIKQVKFRDSNTSTYDFGLLTTYNDTVSNSYLLVSNTTGCRAVIFLAYNGSESAVNRGSMNTNRAYVQYVETGNTAGVPVSEFSSAEQIDIYNTNQKHHGPLNGTNKLGYINVLTSNSTVNALGVGYGMRVTSGTIYQKGFFQKVLPRNFMVVEHSSNVAGRQVGFTTEEYIITEATDESLYDNAIGSFNYQAPGAHRLKLVPVPVVYDVSNTQVSVPKDFLPILEFDGGDGRLVQNNSKDDMTRITDTMAARSHETTGNFMVHPFSVDVIPHESNTESFYYVVGAGIAYVDGYRVQLLSPRRVEVPRATTTADSRGQVATMSMGNYINITDMVGTFDVQTIQEVQLYSSNQEVLSLNQSLTSPMGDWVGNANIRAVVYDSGTIGTNNAIYQAYITNIRMLPGKNFGKDARSIYASGAYGDIYADIVRDNKNRVAIYDTGLKKLLFSTGHVGLKRLTSNVGTNDTTFTYRNTLQASIATVGSVSSATFTIPGPDVFDYGVGYLTDSNAEDLIVTWAQDSLSTSVISNATRTTGNANGYNITSPTSFTAALAVGEGVQLANSTGVTYNTIQSIDSSNSMFVVPSTVPTGTLTIKKFYKEGTPVNFDGSGNTVYVDSSTSITVGIAFEPDTSGYALNAQIPQIRNTAQAIPKVVNKGAVVLLDCNSHWNGIKGPWNLGFPDVYQITNVHVGDINGIPYSDTNPDRLEWFTLSTNQKDDSYQISQLNIKPKYKNSLVNTSTMMVKFNVFTANITSSKSGFFSVDSYSIDDSDPDANSSAIATAQIPLYRDTTSATWDLRNYIDVRPMFANTANLVFGATYATTNPVNNNTTYLTGSSAGISIEPNSNFYYNVEYYLPREDKLILTKDGNVEPKMGTPSLTPKQPPINKTGIEVAEISVPPYPSLTFKESE